MAARTLAPRADYQMFIPATPAQVTFMSKLAVERGLIVTATALTSTTGVTKKFEEISKYEASKMIDFLKSLPATAKAPAPERVELEDGMYRFEGEIYKVVHAVHGSGFQYAKRLVVVQIDEADPAVEVGFERAPGIVRKLRPEHRMTLEEAKEFGALYGVCVRCAAPLTLEESIERGMGEICASKI